MDGMVFLSLLLAHVVGDFYFQNDAFCRDKGDKKIKSLFLYIHSLIIGLISWALLPAAGFWQYAVLIAVTHLLIDAAKSYLGTKLMSFMIDQFLHILILYVISCRYSFGGTLPLEYIDIHGGVSVPAFLTAVLLLMKPVNILIKLVLERYKIGEAESCKDIKNAGALIGNLERILTLVFVLIGQYEAIGLVIAAKSLLRFKDTDTAKTEYVLAGTLLSFGIALICGLAVGMV